MDQWISPYYLLYFKLITTESTSVILAQVNLKNLRIFRNTVYCAIQRPIYFGKKYAFFVFQKIICFILIISSKSGRYFGG